MSARQTYNELLQQRANYLAAAEQAAEKNDLQEAKSQRAKASALDSQLDELSGILADQKKYADDHAAKFGTGERDMQEMGRALMAGESVKIDGAEVRKLIRSNSTLVSGPIVQPTGAGSEIHDPLDTVSSLLDQVNAQDFTGMGAWLEPYAVSDMAAQSGKVSTLAGTARTASDPVFKYAKLAAYEANTTSFVDKNISRLSPARYAEKVQAMAVRALRRKVNSLIVNGDGQASPEMFGIINAKNTAGEDIFAAKNIGSAIAADSLNALVFAYGGDEEFGNNARLLLSKKSLEAIGKVRGTNEKRRLFEISRETANTGYITDGGLIIPYTLCASVGDSKILYGDPMNYMLGMFGDMTVTVDTSVKSVERMVAVLGDAMIGGNLVVHHGFVVGNLADGE